MTEIILQTNHLSKEFGKLRVVNDVNIRAYQGEVFGFLGPNGAGKTTTIGMILGLVHPTAGSVTVLGEDVTPGNVKVLKHVGAMLGAPAFVPYLSARENFKLVARLYPNVGKKRINEVLELVGLTEASHRKVGKFSTGMKQRVGLGMAILHHPKLIILDEPTNGLDPAGMREIRQLIRSLVDHGTSVMLSSHLLAEVQQTCDRIAVINKGKIVTQGLVEELLRGSKPTVRLVVSETARALAILNKLPGVSDIQLNGGNALKIEGISSQEVMACLLENEIQPIEISTEKTNLESLFMTVTNERV